MEREGEREGKKEGWGESKAAREQEQERGGASSPFYSVRSLGRSILGYCQVIEGWGLQNPNSYPEYDRLTSYQAQSIRYDLSAWVCFSPWGIQAGHRAELEGMKLSQVGGFSGDSFQ